MFTAALAHINLIESKIVERLPPCRELPYSRYLATLGKLGYSQRMTSSKCLHFIRARTSEEGNPKELNSGSLFLATVEKSS